MPEKEPKITIPHTPESLGKEFEKYAAGEPFDIYARYSYEKEREWEKKLAEKIGVKDAAITNSGMAAIHTALEAEKLRPGDTILCSKDVYECTSELYEDMRKRGVRVEIFEPGNQEELSKQIRSLDPRAVIFETVANKKEMKMIDLSKVMEITEEINKKRKEVTPESLLKKRLETRFKDKYAALDESEVQELLEGIADFRETNNYFVFRKIFKKISRKTGISSRELYGDLRDVAGYVMKNDKAKLDLIIDNTLPSPELYNPLKNIDPSALTDITIVESGTKHYQLGKDAATLGVAYSNNPEKIKEIKAMRTKIGTYIQPASLSQIPENSLEGMKEKMAKHSHNALELAKTLSQSDKVEAVYHPNLEGHPDKELADKFAPEGIVSLFFIDLKDGVNAQDFTKRLYEVSGHEISLGGSFGHPNTWVLPLGEKNIRIAAGSENQEELEKVKEWLKEALK